MSVTFTRTELYDRVWSTPMSRLAREFGLSDVGLAKICRRHQIPRPPRGYWAKKGVGKPSRRIPLPHPEKQESIELREPLSPDEQAALTSHGKQKVQKDEGPPVVIADSLRGAHEFTSQANQQLQAAETNDQGIILVPKDCAIRASVSKGALRRALLLTDAILKALEQRGHQVAPGPAAVIGGIEVRFSIAERLETKKEPPAEHDLDGSYRFGHSRYNTKRVPTGQLILEIDDGDSYWARGWRSTWRDTEKHQLEPRLGDIVAGLIDFASQKKTHEENVKREEERCREDERRRQAEAQRRAERRELFKAEQARVKGLLERAANWVRASELRAYIEAAKQGHIAVHGDIAPNSEFARWLDWALQQADRLDPFVKSPPSILDEDLSEPEPPRPYSGLWQTSQWTR